MWLLISNPTFAMPKGINRMVKKYFIMKTFNFIFSYVPSAVETYVMDDNEIVKVEQILVGENENGILVTRYVTCTSWGCRNVENDDDNLFFLTANPASEDTLYDFGCMFTVFQNITAEELAEMFIQGFKAWGFKFVFTREGEKMPLETYCRKEAEDALNKAK